MHHLQWVSLAWWMISLHLPLPSANQLRTFVYSPLHHPDHTDEEMVASQPLAFDKKGNSNAD